MFELLRFLALNNLERKRLLLRCSNFLLEKFKMIQSIRLNLNSIPHVRFLGSFAMVYDDRAPLLWSNISLHTLISVRDAQKINCSVVCRVYYIGIYAWQFHPVINTSPIDYQPSLLPYCYYIQVNTLESWVWDVTEIGW